MATETLGWRERFERLAARDAVVGEAGPAAFWRACADLEGWDGRVREPADSEELRYALTALSVAELREIVRELREMPLPLDSGTGAVGALVAAELKGR